MHGFIHTSYVLILMDLQLLAGPPEHSAGWQRSCISMLQGLGHVERGEDCQVKTKASFLLVTMHVWLDSNLLEVPFAFVRLCKTKNIYSSLCAIRWRFRAFEFSYGSSPASPYFCMYAKSCSCITYLPCKHTERIRYTDYQTLPSRVFWLTCVLRKLWQMHILYGLAQPLPSHCQEEHAAGWKVSHLLSRFRMM